jgi:hypothetical protein
MSAAPPATSAPAVETLWSILGLRVRLEAPAAPGGGVDRLVRLVDMFPRTTLGRAEATTYAIRPEGTDGALSLRRDGALVGRSGDAGQLIPLLFGDLTAHAIATFAGFAAHAAVVTGPEGSVAILGESGAGKSTLTAACLRAGLGYCSDEALCLDHDSAAVVPFPKPISLLADSPMLPVAPGTPRRGGFFHADELGGALDHAPPPVAHVVILGERVTGGPVLTPAGPADGVQALLRMGFNHFRAPARAVDVATRVVTGAAVWRLRAGDPARTATAVAELAGTSAGRDGRRAEHN